MPREAPATLRINFSRHNSWSEWLGANGGRSSGGIFRRSRVSVGQLLLRGTLIASWFRTGNSSGIGVPCVVDTIEYLAEVYPAGARSSGSVPVGISGFLFPPDASGYGRDCD
jgi:hypothetical protein